MTNQIPYLAQGASTNQDDPKVEIFITDTLIISLNILCVLWFETSQKTFYSENYAITKFKMILELSLTQAISMKL